MTLKQLLIVLVICTGPIHSWGQEQIDTVQTVDTVLANVLKQFEWKEGKGQDKFCTDLKVVQSYFATKHYAKDFEKGLRDFISYLCLCTRYGWKKE